MLEAFFGASNLFKQFLNCAYRGRSPRVRIAWFCNLSCQIRSTKSPSHPSTVMETDRQPLKWDEHVSHFVTFPAMNVFIVTKGRLFTF